MEGNPEDEFRDGHKEIKENKKRQEKGEIVRLNASLAETQARESPSLSFLRRKKINR